MKISATRLYASAIAIVSGIYAVTSALWGMGSAMPMGDEALGVGPWVMLAVGVVVLVHGAALLTPAARWLGSASGPLMLLWATVMLLQQALAAAMPMTADMGWDAGMVALAVLMGVSGVIMTRREPHTPM